MKQRRVILVTDGDEAAREVLERVAQNIGGRCISRSAGNPTPITGPTLVSLIQQTPYDPVLVMFDDCGSKKEGVGEQALRYVATHPEIEVMGVLAVASNCARRVGTPVHMALDWQGNIRSEGVDKNGEPQIPGPLRVFGDTVEILNSISVPIVIGIGDIGKMHRRDRALIGAPITTKAVQLIIHIFERNRGRLAPV